MGKGDQGVLSRRCADLERLGTLLVARLSSFDLVLHLRCAFVLLKVCLA